MHQLPLTYSMREAAAGLTAGGLAGPLCFRAFTSHDYSNYKQF